MTEEPIYVYRKGHGWVPGGHVESVTVTTGAGLTITLLARPPEIGEHYQWVDKGSHYTTGAGDKPNLTELAKWAGQCVYRFPNGEGYFGAPVWREDSSFIETAVLFTMVIS